MRIFARNWTGAATGFGGVVATMTGGGGSAGAGAGTGAGGGSGGGGAVPRAARGGRVPVGDNVPGGVALFVRAAASAPGVAGRGGSAGGGGGAAGSAAAGGGVGSAVAAGGTAAGEDTVVSAEAELVGAGA